VNNDRRAVGVAVLALVVLGACSQSAAPQVDSVGPTIVPQVATAASSLDPRFNATAAVGGGANSSNVVSTDDLNTVLASLPQANQFKFTANSSPPGSRGAEVLSVSLVGQDTGGVLKGLDQAGKRSLADALLTAAGVAWPNASVTLLMSDPAGAGGQVIGSRPPGGPNSIIVA
jgi:hypothetical protein